MRNWITYLVIVISSSVLAQEDTLMHEEISMITIRDQSETAQAMSEVNSYVPVLANLGESLTKNSSIYIKSYGLGSLSTLSIWGGSSSQCLVTWQDIPIANPMLGLTDLSLIPTFANQSLRINKGGSSVSLGSGAITGSLELRENVKYGARQVGVEAEFSKGSFGRYGTAVNFVLQKEKLHFNLNAFHKTATNDFDYKIGSTLKKLPNSDLTLSGLKLNSGIRISAKDALVLNLWLQTSDKGIPPVTTQNTSVARQHDLTQRIKLKWERLEHNWNVHSHFAYLDEDNDYEDKLLLIAAQNTFKNLVHLTKANFIKDKTRLTLEYTYSNISGISKEYENQKQQLQFFSTYLGLQHQWNAFKLNGEVRKEWRSRATPPIITKFSIEHAIKSFSSKLVVSKEYRAPTLNDLFWVPGGNVDLRPEEGWNQELWFTLNSSKNRLKFSTSFFHRRISNWILWAPLEGQPFWSAYNLGLVRSYGMDLEIEKQIETGTWRANIKAGGSYTKSENLIAQQQPKIALGDQLIYTPLWNSYLIIEAHKNKISSALQLNYTSDAEGINERLNAYFLASLNLGYELHYRKFQSTISLNIENLLNANYRVIERRPMPGRYYDLKWLIKINKYEN